MRYTVTKYREYFTNLHDVEVNQKYAKKLPYSFHLEMVASQAYKFRELIPIEDDEDELFNIILVSCWAHDSIEDARKTYNDILDYCGKEVAEIVYCCTEDKGKNREERHSDAFYQGLVNNKWATFVKLCDIIANVKFSLLSNSGMYDKYYLEYRKTRKILYREEFKKMFDYLDKLFKVEY